MGKDIKKIVNGFRKQQHLATVNYKNLRTAAENIGYTIVEFNNIFNGIDVETIIKNLGIAKAVLQSRGFTYVDKNYRLIFINEDLNEQEKTLIISHELGHIVCEHFTKSPIIGNDVKEEYEANEFSHYLLKRKSLSDWNFLISKHKKIVTGLVLAIIVMAISVVVGVTIKKEQSYYGDYYITSAGNKYHKKECIFVKNKTSTSRLGKEEFETGKYEACDICLPDK